MGPDGVAPLQRLRGASHSVSSDLNQLVGFRVWDLGFRVEELTARYGIKRHMKAPFPPFDGTELEDMNSGLYGTMKR